MLIDWFTVGAQVLNFAILVWLMKRFLYQPVLNAIDAREEQVANALAEAEAIRAQAETEREHFEQQNEQLDRERTNLLNKASQDAEAKRQQLFEGARQAASKMRDERQAALQAETKRLSDVLVQRTQTEVLTIAQQVFKDLAAADFDVRATEVFIARLTVMPADARAALRASIADDSGSVLVKSAFNLPEEQRKAIEAAIRQMLATEVQVQFDTAPHLLGGIELSAGGQKVAWSIADYLGSLQNSIDEMIKPQQPRASQRG